MPEFEPNMQQHIHHHAYNGYQCRVQKDTLKNMSTKKFNKSALCATTRTIDMKVPFVETW